MARDGDKVLSIRLRGEDYEKLQSLAAADMRPLVHVIVLAIREKWDRDLGKVGIGDE